MGLVGRGVLGATATGFPVTLLFSLLSPLLAAGMARLKTTPVGLAVRVVVPGRVRLEVVPQLLGKASLAGMLPTLTGAILLVVVVVRGLWV